jgi:hypothetical protein
MARNYKRRFNPFPIYILPLHPDQPIQLLLFDIMLTPEQVSLLVLAIEGRSAVRAQFIKAFLTAKAKPYTTEHIFLNDGGLLSFAALFFTQRAITQHTPKVRERKALLKYLKQLSDEACRKCARQLEKKLKHEKKVERLKTALHERIITRGLLMMDWYLLGNSCIAPR